MAKAKKKTKRAQRNATPAPDTTPRQTTSGHLAVINNLVNKVGDLRRDVGKAAEEAEEKVSKCVMLCEELEEAIDALQTAVTDRWHSQCDAERANAGKGRGVTP